MPKEMDIIKLNTIKRYIKDVKDMRISSTSAKEIRIRINAILKTAISEAVKSAKKDKRSTLMPRDIKPALELALGKKKLSYTAIFKEIKKLSPIDLGELSKLITSYIETEKQKKK